LLYNDFFLAKEPANPRYGLKNFGCQILW